MNGSRKDPYLHQDWLLEIFFLGGGGGWVSIAKCLNGKYGTNLEIPVGKVGGRKPNNHLAVEIWIFSGTTQ